MRPGKITLTIVALFTFFASGGQQNNIWYFGGNAGISFNPSGTQQVPHAILDGSMATFEGCATISDGRGQLLFYTNGRTVWNKVHTIMQGGDNLFGHLSAFQSSIIVRKPGSTDSFYIFTADAFENDCALGYNYSVVDIRHNGGLGEVVAKNIPMQAPGTERLTAARHGNGTDVWLITNDLNSNTFRAWLVDCNGVRSNPVVSSTGEVLDRHNGQRIGCMKLSPDGKYLCQTHFPQVEATQTDNFFQVFDFNNLTGVISNPKVISNPGSIYIACEFSPNSRLVYLTTPKVPQIEQFDCTQTTAGDMMASRVGIPALENFYAIQLGPDKKIYLTRSQQSLSVINKPDASGFACNFQPDKVPLGRNSNIGLPSFINDLTYNFNSRIDARITDSCAGIVQFNAVTPFGPGVQYAWNFGDGQTSTLQNPVHTYTPPDSNYIASLTLYPAGSCGFIELSRNVVPAGLKATADFSYEAICDSGYVRFTNLSGIFPDTASTQLLWDFGDGTTSTDKNPVHTYPAAGNFNIKLSVFTSKTCLNKSVTKSLDLQLLNIQASPDQQIDQGQHVQLNVAGGGTHFSWSPVTWLSNPSIANPVASPRIDIFYIVTVTNDLGCKDTDTVFIKVNPIPGIYVPTAFTPNNDGINDIFKPTLGEDFTLKDFSIYNRWGQKIFSTIQKGVGWNGKINGIVQNSGVYVWIVAATDITGKLEEKKGTLILIR